MDEIYRKEMCRLYLKNYFKTTLAIQNGFDSLDDTQLTMAKNVQAKLIIERSIMQNKTLTRFKCRFSLLSRLASPTSLLHLLSFQCELVLLAFRCHSDVTSL